MKKSIMALALLAAACMAANAATTYRDRMIPGGGCMVNFGQNHINASLIQEINIRSRRWTTWEGFPKGNVEQPPYMSLRVTLVNGQYYEIKDGNLEAQEVAFLKQIKEECR